MANNLQLATAARNAACNGIVDLADAGSGAGTVKIYTASQPANANTAISDQTLLATITLSDPAFGSASTGAATVSGVPVSGTAVATGTAAWFRMADSDGNTILDGSVGTSSADLILNTVSIVTGNTVQITSGTLTMPAS